LTQYYTYQAAEGNEKHAVKARCAAKDMQWKSIFG